MKITREIGFDMGHMLPDHEGGCYRPHGHRYTLAVTVGGDKTATGPARGMVIDYGALKSVLEFVTDKFDHRFAVAADDPRLAGMRETFAKDPDSLVILGYPPTAENLVGLFTEMVVAEMINRGYNGAVTEAVLWETPTCSATVTL